MFFDAAPVYLAKTGSNKLRNQIALVVNPGMPDLDREEAERRRADPSRAVSGAPTPGRMSSTSPNGNTIFQDEWEYREMCRDRAENGYNSGMGEIFRKVAEISAIQGKKLSTTTVPRLEL